LAQSIRVLTLGTLAISELSTGLSSEAFAPAPIFLDTNLNEKGQQLSSNLSRFRQF